MFKVDKARYDPEKNAIIIDVGDMGSSVTEVEIPFSVVKSALPKSMSKVEQIAELRRIIQRTRQQKLLKIEDYVKKIKAISAGLTGARKKLESAGSKNEITKWRHVCAMWGKEKDVLKEIRYSIKTINDEEAKLELELAKLKTGE